MSNRAGLLAVSKKRHDVPRDLMQQFKLLIALEYFRGQSLPFINCNSSDNHMAPLLEGEGSSNVDILKCIDVSMLTTKLQEIVIS